ncbi:uncharacterized protein EDB93DRAFT_1109664 [Suillus bovinus]|uniref:uncharacterized protein n=1 Tax=Suillus bovinus TaxID=48563 RepID=UPI001B86279D|nr:uncharacterized protein EDB93DRAFT_1109664 [Suillus bovinus]KAG2126368.1 hypothetical protein EDB93DRAFT_1109664 [Suillus bovinus]
MTNPDYEEDQDEIFQYLPQYYLCIKEKRKIIIPPGIQFPDGSAVARNAKMNTRGRLWENVVILVTRQSIPLQVLQGDSEDSSASSESSSSEPPHKIKYCRVLAETNNEILSTSDPETISELATIVDLTASDDEYTGDFFDSFNLDNHDVVTTEPEIPVEADLTPLDSVLTSPLQASGSFAIDPNLDNPLTLQASGSFVLNPSIDNPWEGNHLFNF